MAKTKERQELYTVAKIEHFGDEYDTNPRRDVHPIKSFPFRELAQQEVDKLNNEFKKTWMYKNGADTPYSYIAETIYVSLGMGWQQHPDYLVHLDEVDPIVDTCGQIKELIATPNMSMAYFTLNGTAKEHKHNIMEEFYYITKGRGTITIADMTYEIDEGHSVNIPKGEWHYLKGTLEGIVTTHPRFNPEDVILKQKSF